MVRRSCGDKRSMRVYADEPLHTKIFIEPIAPIVRNRIYTGLKDRMKVVGRKANYMSVPASIRELSKIEMVRQADGAMKRSLDFSRGRPTFDA